MIKAVILGAGGHASVVAECLDPGRYELAGFLDKDEEQKGQMLGGAVILGDDRDPAFWLSMGIKACIVGIGNLGNRSARLREILFERYREAGYEMLTAVHRSAVVSPYAKIGAGSVIMPGAVVNAGAVIGENAIVNSGAVIEHDVILESGVHAGPGSIVSGAARIGRNTFLGAGSCVIQGIEIGSGSIIGAGSTVIRNIPGGVTAVGSPAIVIERP